MTEQELNKACEIVCDLANEYFGDWEQSCKFEDKFRKAMGAVIKENLTPGLTLRDVQKIANIIGHTSRLTRDGTDKKDRG